jgi:hypothetical protein
MNFRMLARTAKIVVDKRGGAEGLKQDLAQLQTIAKGEGSAATKAGKAAAALKTPAAARPKGRAAPSAPEPVAGDGATPPA